MAAYLVLLGGEIGATLPKGQYRAMQRTRGLARLARAMGADPMSWAGLVLAYTPTHAEWLVANETRERMSAQLDKVFSQYDVIFAPATPRTAFPHNHGAFTRRRLKLEDGRELAYGMMLNWISLPPALDHRPRRPVGLGPAGGHADHRVLWLGHEDPRRRPGHRRGLPRLRQPAGVLVAPNPPP
jgi:amidase